jgi:hypothetical protein
MFSEAQKVELVAYVWNTGEEPTEVPLVKDDFNAIQLKVQELLETKEFGKVVRRYETDEVVLYYRAFTDEFRGRMIVGGADEADLAKSYDEHKAFCAQAVYSAADLYAMKPSRVFYDLYHFVGTHLPEIDNYDLNHELAEQTKRIELRQIAYDCPDGRRTWELDTVWFDGHPVMVVNSSGRDGDEYSERFITDGDTFGQMLRFLRNFVEGATVTGFVKADAIIPAMTEFYGRTIHDFYDVVTQTPKKN